MLLVVLGWVAASASADAAERQSDDMDAVAREEGTDGDMEEEGVLRSGAGRDDVGDAAPAACCSCCSPLPCFSGGAWCGASPCLLTDALCCGCHRCCARRLPSPVWTIRCRGSSPVALLLLSLRLLAAAFAFAALLVTLAPVWTRAAAEDPTLGRTVAMPIVCTAPESSNTGLALELAAPALRSH